MTTRSLLYMLSFSYNLPHVLLAGEDAHADSKNTHVDVNRNVYLISNEFADVNARF